MLCRVPLPVALAVAALAGCSFPHAFDELTGTELLVEIGEEGEGTGSGFGFLQTRLSWREVAPCAPVEDLVLLANGIEHTDADFGGSELMQTDLFSFETQCIHEAGFFTDFRDDVAAGGELALSVTNTAGATLAVLEADDALDQRVCELLPQSDLRSGGELVIRWSHPDDEISNMSVELQNYPVDGLPRADATLGEDGLYRAQIPAGAAGTWKLRVNAYPAPRPRVDRCEGVGACGIQTTRWVCEPQTVTVE